MKNNEMLIETVCMLAGKIMLENGSEVYRVEDTMSYISKKNGFFNSINYVTLTGIMFALSGEHFTKIQEIHTRTVDLSKVAEVNLLSRQFCSNLLTLDELYLKLEAISVKKEPYNIYTKMVYAGLVSSSLMIIYGGVVSDFFLTFMIGALGYVSSYCCSKILNVRFLDAFFASLLIGIFTAVSLKYSLTENSDSIIIGAIMPLVPGIMITNSFRDIISGDLISGIARGSEAVFIAAAIGSGIISGLILVRGI